MRTNTKIIIPSPKLGWTSQGNRKSMIAATLKRRKNFALKAKESCTAAIMKVAYQHFMVCTK